MSRLFLFWALVAPSAALDFVVMGDWGGSPRAPFTTPAEVKVAKAMGTVAGATKSSFALALGDNFYVTGVKSVSDSRFKNTFEDVFSSPNLAGDDFFRVISGNHDHYGNVSAEIAYSKISKRWHYPSLYYDFKETSVDGALVHFIMIDTVTLSGDSRFGLAEDEPDLNGDELPGPADPRAAEDQWAWINATLASSDADYILVAGHYPIYSVCEHGPTTNLIQRLQPMMTKFHATGYLAGHDHCAEYLQTDDGLVHHGIGAAHGLDSSTAHSGAVPAGSLKWHHGQVEADGFDANSGAFAHISVAADGLVVEHYDDAGALLFTAPTVPPRKRRA